MWVARPLKGFFGNLAAAAVKKKGVLQQLVLNITTLTTRNESLVALVEKLKGDIKNLERENSCLKKGGQFSARNTNLCTNCKKEVFYLLEACYNLLNNKDKQPPGWRSALLRCGTESTNTILQYITNFSPPLKNIVRSSQNTQATSIVDSGATDVYFSVDSPIVNVDLSAPKVKVGTATGQSQQSTGTGGLNLPQLPSGFPITGHIMPGFRHNLIGVGPLCDADCTVTFTRAAVILRDARGMPVLTGWRENSGPRLWRIALQPGEENLPSMHNTTKMATLEAYSAYDLPSAEALIRYFHAAAGYPVRSTWLTAIIAGN